MKMEFVTKKAEVGSSFELTGNIADCDSGEFFHYSYDPVGNRLIQETNNASNTYIYGSANHLIDVDGVAYEWDAKGNLLNDGMRIYSYDHANRLIARNDQNLIYS